MARSRLALSDSEEHVLRFACVHTVATTVQAQALLSVDKGEAADVLARLARAGLLRAQRFSPEGPGLFKITQAGLARVGGALPGPSASVQRDVAVGWLWLAATQGRLGLHGEVVTGRELRAMESDGSVQGDSEAGSSSPELAGCPLGFRVDLPDGLALHYPDLALVEETGWTVVELLLTAWPLSLRGTLLSAYAAEERVKRVVLAVTEPGIARAIVLSPFAAGLREHLEIYPLRLTGDLILSPWD
jgi:hypothetical protein